MNHKIEFRIFEDLEQRLQELYQQEKFSEAYDLANRYRPLFPNESALLDYWRLTMSARTGNLFQALQLLKEIQRSGFWYDEVLLRKSPSFQALQGRPDFEELVANNRRLQEQERQQTYPMLVLRPKDNPPAGGAAYPLLLALHSNSSTAQATVNFWRTAALQGWLVALPQSTQAMWKNAYSWNDRQQSSQEISNHFTKLSAQYPLDRQRVIIAGHSMGGEVAAWLALSGILPVEGFIALGPGGPFMDELENWQALLDEKPNSRLRGYLVIGTQDPSIPQRNIHKFAELCNSRGIKCQVEELPGVGHEYTPAYDEALLRGLAYIEYLFRPI